VRRVISTGGYFHWRCPRLFPLEVIISTGGHYFHWGSKKWANGQKIGKNEQMPEKQANAKKSGELVKMPPNAQKLGFLYCNTL
jgi:hypothetical protein